MSADRHTDRPEEYVTVSMLKGNFNNNYNILRKGFSSADYCIYLKNSNNKKRLIIDELFFSDRLLHDSFCSRIEIACQEKN